MSADVDKDIRMSYKGGWSYVNPAWQNKPVDAGRVYDVNSMYPWAMKFCLLPYGDPIKFLGEYQDTPGYPLYVLNFSCQFKLKPGHYPSIQLKHSIMYGDNEYIEESKGDEPTVLALTSVDFELFKENYDYWDFTAYGGYMFHGQVGMFADYVDVWFGEKTTQKAAKNAGKVLIAKLMLNGLYGKFGSRQVAYSKIPYLGDDGIVHYKKSDPEEKNGWYGYIPVAAFITSYCRDKIIRGANSVGERFIYADTDSLHIYGDYEPEGLDVDEFRLGAFDHEQTFIRGKFIRQKTYLEISKKNGKEVMTIKCAGMPKKVKGTIKEEEFHEEAIFGGKLVPHVVPGGVILKETTFEIKKMVKPGQSGAEKPIRRKRK